MQKQSQISQIHDKPRRFLCPSSAKYFNWRNI
jgi:hypothetical protein